MNTPQAFKRTRIWTDSVGYNTLTRGNLTARTIVLNMGINENLLLLCSSDFWGERSPKVIYNAHKPPFPSTDKIQRLLFM